MLQNVVYLNICHIILITALTVLTFLSSSAISKKMEQIKMTCEIEYERFEEDTATFCLVSKIKWIWMFNLTFELAKCKAARKNCNQYTKCDLYKRFNSSDGIKCTKKISLVAEITSTSTFWYYIFAGNTIYYNIGRICDLQCICKEYDFSQIVEKDFPQLGKANVEIKDFYNVPELTTTYLTVIPNNNLNIEQSSTKRFQLSALDLCQTYRLTVTIESEPTCINWKINSNLTFSLEIDNATTFPCQYNGTAITIGTSAENGSRVYYKVIFENNYFKSNFTKELKFPTNKMEI